MAITAPPPIEPQLVSVAEIQPLANLQVGIGGVQFHIADRCGVGAKAVEQVARGIRTPSDLIRGLGAACAALGFPAARTSYAAQGTSTVYIRLEPGAVAAIDVPPSLTAFFDDLTEIERLDSAALERARVLAEAWSERAGEHYSLRWQPVGPSQATLIADGPAPGRRQWQTEGGFTTSGSRFSGRYLADARLRLSAATGTEVQFAGNVGLRPPALRNDDSSGPYRDASVQVSQVTRLGVFAADGRYIDFTPSTDATFADGSIGRIDLDGEIAEAGLSWLGVIRATPTSRFNLQLRLGRSSQTLDFQDQRLLLQRYTEADVTLATAHRLQVTSSATLQLQSSLNLAQGFTTSPFGPNDPGRGDYTVIRPLLRLTYAPDAWLVPGLELSGQMASKPLPQLEQFVLGGVTAQRAFEPGTAVGDHGYAARLTLSSHRYAWGWASVKPTLFAEYGAARFRDGDDVLRPAGTAQRADAGLELSLRLGPYVDIDAYAAAILADRGPELIANDDQRLGVQVRLRY